MRKLSRLTVAVGGFLIMAGMVFTGIFFLALFNLIDMNVFVSRTHLLLLTLIFILIGTLDVSIGMILLRR
jgi:hypothetical protein